MSRAKVFPRTSRQILTRTGGFLSGYTHTLQPYAGCQFSCVYCYVREMAVQKANPYGLPWSGWISPKQNAAELLSRTRSLADARIFLSSSTDPYTPLEKRMGLTRACLEVLAKTPPAALVVQTRSPLVLRDAALLASIPHAAVSLTVTTDDDRVRRLFEPDSPSIARRIETLAALRAAGVRTQAAVAPLLPTDAARLAALLDPVADRVVVDDFFRGDGAGGRRSGVARRLLAESGFGEWAEPGAGPRVQRELAARLGSGRVVGSPEGWNQLDWLKDEGSMSHLG